jgi:hypothetical protein
MQKKSISNQHGGFDMVFFGITLGFFTALVVIVGWAFHKIHSNQISQEP